MPMVGDASTLITLGVFIGVLVLVVVFSAIMTSGYDNDEMARQFYEMGFLGYLTKPYRVGDLGKMLRKVLGK